MKRVYFGIIAVILAVCVWHFGVAAAESPKPTQDFMRQKLTYAANVLEGLTLERYDLVVTNAIKLGNMNLTNAFVIVGNPDYRNATVEFQQAVDSLRKNAQKKELWAAYEDYNRVTRSCVNCHRTFRREQHVAAERALTK
jgi:hypothetical protein